jgi:hypothetical protein
MAERFIFSQPSVADRRLYFRGLLLWKGCVETAGTIRDHKWTGAKEEVSVARLFAVGITY